MSGGKLRARRSGLWALCDVWDAQRHTLDAASLAHVVCDNVERDAHALKALSVESSPVPTHVWTAACDTRAADGELSVTGPSTSTIHMGA